MIRLPIVFCALLIALTITACFSPKTGCLDIAATNFDASADKDCCCSYPKLSLFVNQVYDTSIFKNDTLYPDASGHLFRIQSVAFYLSDFKLTQNGNVLQVSDTLTLKTFSGTDTVRQLFTNDFQLVRRTPIVYTIGTFRQDGIFNSVNILLGLNSDAQKVIPTKAPAGHPLAAQTDSLWRGHTNGFVFLQAIVVRDSMAATQPDTLRFLQADLDKYRLIGTGTFVHHTGYDFPILLTVDYKKMFEGINWAGTDISAWKATIVANLPNTFHITQ